MQRGATYARGRAVRLNSRKLEPNAGEICGRLDSCHIRTRQRGPTQNPLRAYHSRMFIVH